MSFLYHVECKECGRELDHKARMDQGFDIMVEIEPCPDCIRDAVADSNESQDDEG